MSAHHFLLTEPRSVREVEAVAASLGLTLANDYPWDDAVRSVVWSRGDVSLTFGADARSGTGMVIASDGTLAEQLERRLPLESVASAMQQAREATGARERVRHVFRVATLLLVPALPREPLLDVIAERLHDDEPLVRWAAARILRRRSDRYTEQKLAEAARVHPELLAVHAFVREGCEAAEDGTLHDFETDDVWELIRRAREGADANQWKRVERATDALLEIDTKHMEGLLLRALAYEQAGERTLALALTAASEAEQTVLAIESLAEDEQPERRALLERTQQARARLEQSVERDPEAEHELMSWLERWAEASTLTAGAADALVDRVPSLAGLLALLAGRYRHDVPLLRRAVDLLPDAPETHFALAQALSAADQTADAETVYRVTLDRLDVPLDSRSELARRAHALTEDELGPAAVLNELAGAAYDAERWDEAADHADRLVALDPGSALGWQIRANARTFGGRLADAAVAYGEAHVALDDMYRDPEAIYFGRDPRPQMRLNHASVLAKQGRIDESLEQLRHAARADAEVAQQAKTDDYFELLWNDDRFAAILAGETQALLLEKEKEPEYLEGLVRRCLADSHFGSARETIRQCQEAVALAELLGRRDLVVHVRSIWARTLAFAVDPFDGLEQIEQALAQREHVEGELEAMLVHTHGFVLHQCERFDEAEQAYREGLKLRGKLCGDDHPVLAKGLGELARLALDRGDREAGLQFNAEGLALVDAYLAEHGNEDVDDVYEALADATTLQVNQARIRAQLDDLAGAVEGLELGVQRIRRAIAADVPMPQLFLDNAIDLATSLTQVGEADLRLRAQTVLYALETATFDGLPSFEVDERLFWRRLGALARRLQVHGVDDVAFAAMLTRSMRGELSADELGAFPELTGLPNELAAKIERYPTLSVMLALGLSSVDSGAASLGKTLEDLEELCVGSLYEAGAPAQG